MITLHLNPHYHLYSYHALLTQEIVLTKVTKLEYGDHLVEAFLENTLLAGIYSFATEVDRNKFVRRCNKSVELECCFVAQFDRPATEVVDIKAIKPRSKKNAPKPKPATSPVAAKRKSTGKKE